MDNNISKIIRTTIENSITKYFKNKKVKTTHFLDELFPKERRIRSIMGGLETSLGTQLWEPLANAFAKYNGFEIKDVKKFNEKVPVLPDNITNLIANWEKQKNVNPSLSHKVFINELRKSLDSIDYNNLSFQKIPKGEGIDIWISKNNIEYMYDIKTNQINAGSGPKFNRNILNWYAYRLIMDSSINLECKLAFPFNPHNENFWLKEKGKISPLIPQEEAVVGDEFWNFLLGKENSTQLIFDSFKILGKEGFANKFNDIFEIK
ncbi:TdeIII family type II restriction endonuclease [Aliarcobacter butzleri]|uniref:TdeIII family type II restriction endonuclease n=1 Tax=Aliarcobacter butzleri TaxID=28197 RepID=UPI003AFB35D3